MHVSFLKLSTPALTNVKTDAIRLAKVHGINAIGLLCAAILCLCVPSSLRAQDAAAPKLTIKGNKFTPETIEVPANQRFQIEVENQDVTPAEFESSDLRVEKFVVGGGKIVVRISPLKPGTYKFFDDYHPDTAKGTITAK